MNESLSIFFPFYNDAGTVEKMITDAYLYGNRLTTDLEVIVINDGSIDHTLAEIKNMQQRFPQLRLINHETNKGYGGALISGINNSTKNWVFYTDGDAQYHLDELEKIWKIRKGHDTINGYKLSRSDNMMRKLLGLSYRRVIKFIFNIPVRDIDCDYRLVKGDIIRSLDLKCNSGAITVELIKKLYLKTDRFAEVGIHHYSRVYGKSVFFTFRNILDTLKDEIALLKEFKRLKS